ncbi:MAG: hypothetical protein LIO70_01305 [Clostridiales bacterium]|nr:hypothetical protein [Clostridiales bacterium]
MNIKDYLTEAEILAQLAEEAAELAQAALKLRRVLDGTNPTPVTAIDAKAQLREEFADVLNCIEPILTAGDALMLPTIQDAKRERWLKRLEERQ